MTYDTVLYRGSKYGSVNPDMMISYAYQFEEGGNFPTIKLKRTGGLIITPSFGITIFEGYDKNKLYIPGMKYYAFTTLLDKTITNIQENIFTLFPNVNSTEFEVDSRALEIFQTEKAFTTAGMTAVPAVWTNSTSECFPGIKITSKNGSVTIPLEDAIPIVAMLKQFDPMVYAAAMLSFFGRMPQS